ncbi:MAG TPA: Uma2 family endonuclease [Chitinophagales bacterium]|nr:Uma2 family endonuclease [Chitinophagales bacterium]
MDSELLELNTFVLNANALHLTEDEFFDFCIQNRPLNFERSANKEIILMPPTGTDTGRTNTFLTTDLEIWNRKMKLGYTFDSSTGFTLPNTAVRNPDASWILKERYDALSSEDKKKFAHICPDFIVELKSESDSLKYLKNKMNEWIQNGARLGFLIVPEQKKVFIYRPGKAIEEKSITKKLSGEQVLPGFELDLTFLLT